MRESYIEMSQDESKLTNDYYSMLHIEADELKVNSTLHESVVVENAVAHTINIVLKNVNHFCEEKYVDKSNILLYTSFCLKLLSLIADSCHQMPKPRGIGNMEHSVG